MCARLMQNCMGLFSNAKKLFVWRLRLRVQKVTPLLTLGDQNVKSPNQYKYLGIALETEFSHDKDIQRQLRYQYCAANKLRTSFSWCSNAVKNVLFRSFCMHHNYGVISGSHACRGCMWHIILDSELYATFPGEWVLVATRFNVTFLPLRLCNVPVCRNMQNI